MRTALAAATAALTLMTAGQALGQQHDSAVPVEMKPVLDRLCLSFFSGAGRQSAQEFTRQFRGGEVSILPTSNGCMILAEGEVQFLADVDATLGGYSQYNHFTQIGETMPIRKFGTPGPGTLQWETMGEQAKLVGTWSRN